MQARSGLFGGALMAAGLLGGAAQGGGSPGQIAYSYAAVYAQTVGGVYAGQYAYGPGETAEQGYSGMGLTMYAQATGEQIGVQHSRAVDDTLWNYSYTGAGALFGVTADSTVTIAWDFGAWSYGGGYLYDVTNQQVVFELDAAVDQQTGAVMVELFAGTEYDFFCGLGNEFGAKEPAPGGGVGFISLAFDASPILEQPESRVTDVGSNVGFSVVAPGAESFQWRKDGAPIGMSSRGALGAESDTLELLAVTAGEMGEYDCVVMRNGQAYTSEGAVLAVRPCLPGDSNGDGAVNFSDLNEVLSQFGASCIGAR